VTIATRSLVEHVEHPFGKGSLTTNGAQYSSAVTSIGTTYTELEKATIKLPTGVTAVEVEVAATAALKASGSTDDINWKVQASDDGSSWDDLISEQTLSNTTDYTDVTASGRVDADGGTNFKLSGTSTSPTSRTFYVRVVAKSAGSTDTVSGKVKNSSYVKVLWRQYATE